MRLVRTDKGTAELRSGERQLGVRQRALLLMVADAGTTALALQPAFGDKAEAIVAQLLASGHLAVADQSASSRTVRQIPPSVITPTSGLAASSATEGRVAPDRDQAPVTRSRGSLAGARMFLFEQCERLYGRRDPQRYERIREQLRQARDASAMMSVAEAMLGDLHLEAGAARAAALRSQYEELLSGRFSIGSAGV